MGRMTDQDRLNALHHGIVQQFDEDALRKICLNLQLNYDALPGRGKHSKVWLLLEQLKDDGRISRLFGLLKESKPDVNWDELLKGQQDSKSKSSGQSHMNTDSSLFKNPVVVGALITAFVTLAVSLIGGFFNLRATDRPIEATQTAEARLTMVSTMQVGTPQSNQIEPGTSLPNLLVNTTEAPTLTLVAATQVSPVTESNSTLLPAVTVIGIPDTPGPTRIPVPESETSMIFGASVGMFFDGELVIAVYDASWEDKRTTYGISAPGTIEEVVTDQTVGNRYSFVQNGVYEVAVTGFSSFGEGAEFTVTRLQRPAQEMPTRETINVCKNDTGMSFNRSLLITVLKAEWSNRLVSFEVFTPGMGTLQVVNQTVGKKFWYEENGKYEIQVKEISSFGECATFYIWRLI